MSAFRHAHARRVTRLAAVMICALAAHGAAKADADNSARILIEKFMFQPMSLTVKAGSTVTWINKDEEPHTVASDSQLFRSGGMDTNESFSFKFDKPGTYRFTCSIHPQMTGTVIVR